MAASPGGLGGIRGLPMLRLLLSNIGMHVVGSQFSLPNADLVFSKPLEQAQTAALEQQVREVLDLAKRYKNLPFWSLRLLKICKN